jgi:hypothetical protein
MEMNLLSKIIKPKSKTELIKSLNAIRSAQIQVIEVLNPSAKKDVTDLFDKMVRSGQFSVVFIKQR